RAQARRPVPGGGPRGPGGGGGGGGPRPPPSVGLTAWSNPRQAKACGRIGEQGSSSRLRTDHVFDGFAAPSGDEAAGGVGAASDCSVDGPNTSVSSLPSAVSRHLRVQS